MTTEDDFQAKLDADADDWQTRLVFADWLQERGDPRAEGYRALGVLQRGAWCFLGGAPGYRWAFIAWQFTNRESYAQRCELSRDWIRAMFRLVKRRMHPPQRRSDTPSIGFANRREAEDAAALGFAKLPAARRAELLTPEPVS